MSTRSRIDWTSLSDQLMAYSDKRSGRACAIVAVLKLMFQYAIAKIRKMTSYERGCISMRCVFNDPITLCADKKSPVTGVYGVTNFRHGTSSSAPSRRLVSGRKSDEGRSDIPQGFSFKVAKRLPPWYVQRLHCIYGSAY